MSDYKVVDGRINRLFSLMHSDEKPDERKIAQTLRQIAATLSKTQLKDEQLRSIKDRLSLFATLSSPNIQKKMKELGLKAA